VKATAAAHANIALVKYWGKRDEALLLPEAGSLSVALDKLLTTTTVELGDFAAGIPKIRAGPVRSSMPPGFASARASPPATIFPPPPASPRAPADSRRWR